MSDDVTDIAAYYGSDPDWEHERLDRHQLEYALTWRYLDRHLPAQGPLVEVGAATGRYTLVLPQRGCFARADELVPLHESIGF